MLVAGQGFLQPASVSAATANASLSHPTGAHDQRWANIRTLVSQGACRDALPLIDGVLDESPDNARALAYRSLCQKRLRGRSQFERLSNAEYVATQETLRREQAAQRRAEAQARVIERELQKQQAAWDEQVNALAKESARRRSAELDRLREAMLQRAGSRQQQLRDIIEAYRKQYPNAGIAPAAAPQEADEGALTETSVSSAEDEEAAAAYGLGLEELPRVPPGAVQLFSDQLRAAPERNLAIAEGHVRVLFDDGMLTCDRVNVFTDTKDVYAQGHVRLERGQDIVRGEMIHYNVNTKKGRVLEGTASSAVWHEHGRVLEHIAEGVVRVTPGAITSCEFDPPHFRFQTTGSTVFTEDQIARGRNVMLMIDEFPLIYFPWLSVANRQTPFFLIPGKKKPWEQFALMGYRYELPEGHDGALRWDWRRTMGWGVGIDHRFDNRDWGKGLVKLYFNEERFNRIRKEDTVKGAKDNRYRVLVRHHWRPLEETSIVTDLQKFSDAAFRKDLLFREEYVYGPEPESYVSLVQNDPNYTATVLARKRLNRFQSVTEAYPELNLSTRSQQIGDSNFYSSSSVGFANLQTKNAHSEVDTDVVRADWSQNVSYAMNLFRPILLSPGFGVTQSYHTKDKQGGAERPDGQRNVFVGQFSGGIDASLTLFRLFPVQTNWMNLNLNGLRHVLTPTIKHSYIHEPTVPNANLSFASASGSVHRLLFAIENKLQTKRRVSTKTVAAAMNDGATTQEGLVVETTASKDVKPRSIDVARWIVEVPYTFQSHTNKAGGELGDWSFDLELFPWPWLRVESDWSYPSHFTKGSRDRRFTSWSIDLVMVGGRGDVLAQDAPDIQAPQVRTYQPGPAPEGLQLLPQGQWYLGLRQAYSHNDKTEGAVQFDWRLSEKWQIGTFHRFTWKEVVNAAKRFNNFREYQCTLTRDLHDWMGEVVYRVDREFGEELYLTLTLKAFPEMPIAFEESYHQPKFGSQSSPFSPLVRRR